MGSQRVRQDLGTFTFTGYTVHGYLPPLSMLPVCPDGVSFAVHEPFRLL